MLGELVVNEIKNIEHQKTCDCPTCAASVAIRAANAVIMRFSGCTCPVCAECRSALVGQVAKLKDVVEMQRNLNEAIAAMQRSPIIRLDDDYNEALRVEIHNTGAIKALSMALLGNARQYRSICEAAHHAYEIIERSRGADQFINATLVALNQISDPRDVN